MARLFLSLLCSFAIALQVLVIAGCGGSPSTTSSSGSSGGSGSGGSGSGGTGSGGTGSGSGGTSPGPIGGSPSDTSAGCGGAGYGYTNGNGEITGVWMQSPTPGQNPSNVTVTATAYGPATVARWTVCLDGQSVYQTNSDASSISQAIVIPTGQHLLWASAADAAGDSDRSEIHLIQVGTPPASSTVLPTPPADAQVLAEMQNDTANWTICSLCAAGTNTTGNYTMTFDQSQPSMSGSSLEMYADGPSWTNVLFMDTKLGTSSKTNFLWDFWVYHDPASEAHFWSSELDLWQVLGGNEFMIGSQCDFGDGYWATWDSQGGAWVLSGIPCPHWAPGWHHVQWYYERLNSTQYRYDTLVFDGQAYGFNQTWNVNTTTWPDMIGIQYQLDQDPTGTPLHEWVDNVTLTMW
ncbi:MAG: hypothetical protein WBV28_11135 [Terracidiphilus sp.]